MEVKKNHLETTHIFQDPIFHFHDYGRKSNICAGKCSLSSEHRKFYQSHPYEDLTAGVMNPTDSTFSQRNTSLVSQGEPGGFSHNLKNLKMPTKKCQGKWGGFCGCEKIQLSVSTCPPFLPKYMTGRQENAHHNKHHYDMNFRDMNYLM